MEKQKIPFTFEEVVRFAKPGDKPKENELAWPTYVSEATVFTSMVSAYFTEYRNTEDEDYTTRTALIRSFVHYLRGIDKETINAAHREIKLLEIRKKRAKNEK